MFTYQSNIERSSRRGTTRTAGRVRVCGSTRSIDIEESSVNENQTSDGTHRSIIHTYIYIIQPLRVSIYYTYLPTYPPTRVSTHRTSHSASASRLTCPRPRTRSAHRHAPWNERTNERMMMTMSAVATTNAVATTSGRYVRRYIYIIDAIRGYAMRDTDGSR